MKLKFKRIILSLVLAAIVAGSGVTNLITTSSVEAAKQKSHSDTVLQVKFNDDSGIELNKNEFIDSSGKAINGLNSVLNQRKVAKKARLFTADKSTINATRHAAQVKSGKHVADLNGYYRLTFEEGTDLDTVAQELRNTGLVSEAYAEPLAVPAPDIATTPDFISNQLYLNDSTYGMSITSGSNFPGAKAASVKIADIEYSWNTNHEDLSKARATDARLNTGTPKDSYNNTDHGTAVIGLLSADNNGHGVSGIASDASLRLANASSVENGWNVANAVYLSAANLNAGDVILIEQQTSGPVAGTYVPVEWIPAVYDAISMATAKGIIVVEPAGNSNLNLNDSIYGASFPLGKADSGAIIVGAGAGCGTYNPARSRLAFSNYGSRVNMQASGECVASTGYGNLYTGSGPDQWYTGYFNGTSSASALIAGVSASVSSSYKQINGSIPTPQQIRSLLVNSGYAQDTSVNPGNIGPLPNLVNAQKQIDKSAPTAPTSLVASLNSNNKVFLAWKPSTDNVAVTNYKIYRNNSLIATVGNITSYTDTTVYKRTTYSYKIVALDGSGNVSAYSNSVSIKTR